MPTTKRTKSRKKKGVVAGKILPPLDVNSSSLLKSFEEVVKQGPLTLILIYADWCGHCHEIMPHWDKASASPHRSIQSVKVNEKMLDKVNSTINSSINQSAEPIDVTAYPTILLVDPKGNKISNIEPVKDDKALSKVMNESGSLSKQAGLNASPSPASMPLPLSASMPLPLSASMPKNKSMETPMDTMPLNIQANRNKQSSIQRDTPLPVRSASRNDELSQEDVPAPLPPSSLVERDNSEESSSLYSENPPSKEERQNVLLTNSMAMRPENKMRGGNGGLYSAITQSAYTLAPTAVLMGAAAYVMKSKSRRGRRSRRSKSRPTRRAQKRSVRR